MESVFGIILLLVMAIVMWCVASEGAFGADPAASVLGRSLALAQDAPPPLHGTLDQVNGNGVAIKARNGTSSTVQLKGDNQDENFSPRLSRYRIGTLL